MNRGCRVFCLCQSGPAWSHTKASGERDVLIGQPAQEAVPRVTWQSQLGQHRLTFTDVPVEKGSADATLTKLKTCVRDSFHSLCCNTQCHKLLLRLQRHWAIKPDASVLTGRKRNLSIANEIEITAQKAVWVSYHLICAYVIDRDWPWELEWRVLDVVQSCHFFKKQNENFWCMSRLVFRCNLKNAWCFCCPLKQNQVSWVHLLELP